MSSDGRAHAILGASSADRWMNCPASIRLIKMAPPQKSSKYAQEGTAAHNLAEIALRMDVAPHFFIGQYINVLGELMEEEPEEYDDENCPFEIDDDMADAVAVYSKSIQEQADFLRNIFGQEPILFLEKSFNLERLYPGMFGTNDYSLFIVGEMLVVIDYKHGRGKVVEVKNNPQLLYYALGAILEVCKTTADLPKKIRIMIVQPRAAHRDGVVRFEDYDLAEVQSFAKVLVKKAKDTEREDTVPNPGDWCQFCAANGTTCHAVRDRAQELAMTDFADLAPDEHGIQTITVDDLIQRTLSKPGGLSAALKLAPVLDAYVRGIETYAQHELENGRPILDADGNKTHKLVRKRSNRRWKREAEATVKLKIEEGVITKEQAYKSKLNTPAQLEKTPLGKKLVATICEQPPGGITLASIDDARDEVEMNPFSDLDESDLVMIGKADSNIIDAEFEVINFGALPAPDDDADFGNSDDWDIV